MKHWLFSLFLALNLTAHAAAPALPNESTSPEAAVAPVMMKSDAKTDEAHVGVITAEPTPQRADALTIFRQELNRQAQAAQARAEKDGVIVTANKRFAPESLTFFVAIGAVTFNSMWIRSHGDPLAMERHINSLKDPIAQISFYAFMQTQGYYMDLRMKRSGLQAMDPVTRNQFIRRLTYEGMAIGSLASSLVSDLGHSAKMCVDKWLKGKTDEASLASCSEAWHQWTFRNKFTQYFPQVMSMWASQLATNLIESTAARAFDKVAATAFVRGILTRDFLVKFAYKFTAADVVLTFAGGGWVTKSIKIVGKVTRFGLFVGVDQILSRYTYRPVNNLLQPAFFDIDAVLINDIWSKADAGNWDQGRISDPESVVKFEKRIDNFGKRMQQWREHLNQDAETDLAGWMEMTKKILNQVDYSYKYYKGFANTLFETLNTGNRIKAGELEASAAGVISGYPLRTLPFYAASPGPYKPIGGQMGDMYLVAPAEMQQHQKENALAVAKIFSQKTLSPKIKDSEKTEYRDGILGKILSGDNFKMATGFKNMNETLELHYLEMQNSESGYSSNSHEYIDLLSDLQDALGHPLPVVYPFAGYSQAFAAFGANQVTAQAADFGKWSISSRYKFNKEADLMFYHLMCGNSQARLNSVKLAGVNFAQPQFEPPSLLRPGTDKESFCSDIRTTENLYSAKIHGLSLRDFLLKNISYTAIGDFRGPETNAGAFEAWWLRNAKAPMSAAFKDFDSRYKKVYREAYDNFFNRRSLYKQLVDFLNQSRYLQKDLQANLKFESNLYLQILSRTLRSGPVAPAREERPLSWLWNKVTFSPFNYVDFPRQNSVTGQFQSMYKSTPPEVQRINDLLNAYYGFISNPGVNFDQYIAHSKKIDTAINDALVKAGLKKVTLLQAAPDAGEDLAAPASASGTELSQKVYEDVPVKAMTYRQRMTLAAVKGLRLVESEIRRFIRMRVMLSQSLDIDTKEFMADWNNANPPILTRPRSANPFGG